MHDYTGPHDYFNEEYVKEWTQIANSRRPFRLQFFEAFAAELAILSKPRILDLGSGPGFLAEHILDRCDAAAYHLFDFSPHMLNLSRARLGRFAERVGFHRGSFLEEDWWQMLPSPFDAIVSLQAVHEVRQADRIPQLYRELRALLGDEGIVLIADQVNDEEKQEEHFLTASDHETALREAGFDEVRQVCAIGDLKMFAGKVGSSCA